VAVAARREASVGPIPRFPWSWRSAASGLLPMQPRLRRLCGLLRTVSEHQNLWTQMGRAAMTSLSAVIAAGYLGAVTANASCAP
jgi:hypothetical protein